MILYTFPIRTAFIDRDLEMISPTMRIKALEFTQSPIQLPFYFLLQLIQILWFLPQTSQYLCFFGGYHSVLPVWFAKLTGKKCIIQAGGTDCINMPEIGYGNFRKKWLRKATVYSFKNCALILPVASALVEQNYHFDPSISPIQGLKNLIPNLNTPITIIPNGFDTVFWKDSRRQRAAFSFISVATGTSNWSRARVKGYDLIEQLAANHPEWKFTLIGDQNYFSSNKNVLILGKQTPSQLHQLYNEHQFYLQLSTSEGFPNSLGEAMSCGCIPIGSEVGAIPEIIGNPKLILSKKDIEKLETLFLNLKTENLEHLSAEANKRIQENFNFQRRQKGLIQALQI
jgi:glycosyltransferase involved in cell wall biosynthesis